MKTCIKLLKITGAVCLSGVCLTSKADRRILTLEGLRNSLEESREKLESEKLRFLKKADDAYNEWQTCDRQISQKIQSLVNEKNEVDKKVKTKLQSLRSLATILLDKLLDERLISRQLLDQRFKSCQLKIKRQSAAKKVEYNAEGEPISIDFIGDPFYLPKEAIYPDTKRPSSYKEYNEKHLVQKPCGLNKISHPLEKEDLKKRRIMDGELECLGNVSIHEITFDSI